jgi:hypothetical protein
MKQTISGLATIHATALKNLSVELAMNFDVPAQRLINYAISRMGIDRVTYEKILAYQGGTEYVPIPARLLARWAAY